MRKVIVLLLFVVCNAAFTVAQIRGTQYTVNISPDHKDWNYKVGETVEFSVSVLDNGTLVDNASIVYEMGPEMYPTEKKEMTLKDGTVKLKGSMKKPGFYRLTVTARIKGKEYKELCAVAFSPEKIQPTTKCPADFDEFWNNTIANARNTALESIFEYLPERSSPDVNTYHVSFQNDRWGRRVYGILNVPAKAGKYPALLKLPGAGVRPYSGDLWLCRKGVIVLEIGIHGIPVTKEQQYYNEIASAALADYWEHGTNNREKNYYKHVITGCVRAIDFIQSIDKGGVSWDGHNLGVTGSSQGGFLTLATTALDKRVSCFAVIHAAMCDYEAALKKQACGWPHYFYNVSNPDERQVEQSRYYDGVNFARRITVPGYFSFGYNDEVVPPTTTYGTYNICASADKMVSPYPQTQHFWYQEQYDECFDYLLRKLNK